MTNESTCYICGIALDGDNKSFEHIIPNCIGGQDGSYDLLCRNCNTQLGLEIEGDFAKSLNPICSLLQIKRDRNKIPHIKNLTDEQGNLYHLENGRKPVRAKPSITRHEKHYSISARDKKELYHIIEKIKAKEPTLDTENLEQKLSGTKARLQTPLQFELNIGGEPFFRTIAKTAVNAYLFLGGDRKYITNAVQYITNPQLASTAFIHYHVEQEATMSLGATEVCHCIYIKGDNEHKILFVYVELFNGPSFVVKLSDCFVEQSFEKTYCIDVLEGKEIFKTVTLKYPEGASPEGYKPHDPIFFPVMESRLSRIMKISHLRQTRMIFHDEFQELWNECKQNYNDDPVNNRHQSQRFLDKVAFLLVDLLDQ